jgi:hypothetical protein
MRFAVARYRSTIILIWHVAGLRRRVPAKKVSDYTSLIHPTPMKTEPSPSIFVSARLVMSASDHTRIRLVYSRSCGGERDVAQIRVPRL